MNNLNNKLMALEKSKDSTTKEIEDMSLRVDQANVLYNQVCSTVHMLFHERRVVKIVK